MVFTPDKEYDLGGDWYFSDSEGGWLTLEKAFTSSENGNYESWVLATVSDNSVEFFINDIYGSIQRKYVYSGPKLSELTLEDHYEWKIGPSGYNDWVPTPPPFPVSQDLNLGASMSGQEYISSFLPNTDFSYIEPTSSVIIKNAQELSIGLKFEDGKWVSE